MPWTKIYPDKSAFEKAAKESKEPLRGLSYADALREAQAQLLRNDDRVFIMGEGIDDPGGVFGSTKDLHKEFGGERVFDTPLAENGLTGIAMGSAIAGLRPILVHMRVDFIPLSLDQIINHAAKWHYMFGGKVNVPLVVRSIVGRGWGSAAQHSQTLHSLLAHAPGLKVVLPATPYDAKGLLMAASTDGNPVIFIEHRWLYGHMGHVPEAPYTVPIGKAIVRRKGADVTIAAVSHMAVEATKAADELMKDGLDAEVIDLRTIKPLDHETVIESVKKTGRLIVADTGWRDFGVGAELSARVVEEAFGALKAPVKRINIAEAPTPASPVLEEAFYPGPADIKKAAIELLKF
jgi:pyruvate dehydrogenase E1 component beta subunit